jgi:predicted MFS family arabinose efflux permease
MNLLKLRTKTENGLELKMRITTINEKPIHVKAVSPWLTLLLASACGLVVANIYYAQPLVGPIREALGFSPETAGFIVTLAQIGYSMGLLLMVPLGDLIENRRLVVTLLCLAVLALLGVAASSSPLPFLVAALFVGLGSVAVQVLIPYAAHMAPEAVRGQVVGNVMSGLMLGIMLARPISSFITQISSWRMVFVFSASAVAVMALVLWRTLPKRTPTSKMSYGKLLGSMARMALTTPILQRRAIYHAFLFAAFHLFWTTTPLLLAGPLFQFSQGDIALFALAGVAGAIASPIAGRVADRGWIRPATGLAMIAAAISFLLTHIAPQGSRLSLVLLVAAAILLDFGVSATMTLGQRAIFALGAEYRSRLNSLYMTMSFIGGGIGSALGGWCFAQGGWELTSWVGFCLPVVALLYYVTER